MKKILFTILMSVMALSASAQLNFKSVDVKADLRGDFGFGVGTTIGLIDNFDIAPNLNIYFADGASSCFTVDFDFHYNIDLGNEFHLYPMAGPVIYHFSYKNDLGNFTRLGLNLGCGLDYDLDYNWTVFAEAKYQFIFNTDGYDDTFLSLGVKYRF